MVSTRGCVVLLCHVIYIRIVTTFAKQTGDYHVLSHTDIKVIALTYQLECELSDGRGSHLRIQPIRQVCNVNREPGQLLC